MLAELFQTIVQSQQSSSIALDQKNRLPPLFLGIVTDTADPDSNRRILCSTDLIPGLNTYWIRRLLVQPQYDPPLPVIGQTVLLLSVNGDFDSTYYLSTVNDTNPPIKKDSEEKDLALIIPGDSRSEIQGKEELIIGKSQKTETTEKIEFYAGTSIKFKTAKGAYLELAESGSVILSDAFGHRITLGGGGSFDRIQWDLSGHALNIINASDFTISSSANTNKSIATLGAIDTNSDVISDRGW